MNIFTLLCISQDANITTSILTLKVTSENDNAELTCRATNPWFSGGAIEDKRIIRVACKYTNTNTNTTHTCESQL